MASSTDVTKVLLEWTETFMRGQMTGFVRYARECGLSMSQAGTLFRLHGRGLTKGVSDIGDHLGVSSAAASQLLDRLVQQGLILRNEDPDDRRAKKISLTDRGRDFIENGMKGRERWFTSLADSMTAEEREAVLAGLKILVRKIEEAVPEGVVFDQAENTKESALQ